jgi:hypothetical protein
MVVRSVGNQDHHESIDLGRSLAGAGKLGRAAGENAVSLNSTETHGIWTAQRNEESISAAEDS